MNWDDYEEADRANFSPFRQELITGCKECGASIRGLDEKALKKKRRQHATLHLRSLFYIKSVMDRIGAKEEVDGKLKQHLDSLTDSIAHQLHSEFKNYLRYIFDSQEIWPRLKVSQKGNLEWTVKQEWRSLDEKEKEGFLRYAKDFVETVLPEITPEAIVSTAEINPETEFR